MTIQYDRPGHPTVFLKGEPLPPLSVEECGCTLCRDIMRKEKEEGYHGGLHDSLHDDLHYVSGPHDSLQLEDTSGVR